MGDEYFTSYSDLDVHRLMLTDEPRMNSYKNAIDSNKDIFQNKVVMDVGSGTGVLAIMCAQAGAKKVYAVEASDIAKLSEKLVKENNVSDIVQVFNTRVEDLDLPDNQKVDIIVSEWMGFYLLHEGMLDSVLVARDKFLKLGGRMFPEIAALYASPCSLPDLYKFWTDVSGINLSVFGNELRKSKSNQPDVALVNAEDLLSEPVCVFELNLRTLQTEELNKFSCSHVVCANKDGLYQGLCIWFTCTFPSPIITDQLVLSTAPFSQPTHWKQTVIVLPDEYSVEEREPLAWEINLTRSDENPRHYNIQFTMLDPEKVAHAVPCNCYMTKCIVSRTFLECEGEPGDIIDMT
ncbi:Uncharacterized protein GBIM_20650 [Gryllus bimaculatus]|nr:Uncharacterized protein GBIM_20650 [Gryllus bimaculatus]